MQPISDIPEQKIDNPEIDYSKIPPEQFYMPPPQDFDCNICYEKVLAKGSQFGLLCIFLRII